MLFVDDSPWDCFVHLAATLRRNGIRTVRLTTVYPRRALTAFGLVFDETVCTSTPGWEAALERVLGLVALVDVQTTETCASLAYGVSTLAHGAHAARWAARAAMVDKFVIAQTMRAAGVLVPDTVAADEATSAGVVAALGFPLVCKPRVGNGGLNVHVIYDVAELDRLRASPRGNQFFYERHIAGEEFSFGALATDEGIAASVCYAVAGRTTATGPPALVEPHYLPQLAAIAAQVVNATGMRGLLNLNAIRDLDGDLWIHDVNPRAWGSLHVSTAMGVDMGHAYTRWLKGLPIPRGRFRAGVRPITVYPAAVVNGAPDFRASMAFAGWLWRERLECGMSLSMVEAVRYRRAFRPQSLRTAPGVTIPG